MSLELEGFVKDKLKRAVEISELEHSVAGTTRMT
jgi:hypothetical protein